MNSSALYMPFLSVPQPASRVRANLCDEDIVAACDRHLEEVSARNKRLIPKEIYEMLLTGRKKAV